MPLKHHTETAYLILLVCITCAYGLLLSLLPHFPEGVLYWSILMLVAVVYPLVLTPTFRSNRADYEFRFLHWVPAFMAVLWLVLELLSGYQAALILQLGFLYLWSLPLVVLAVTLVILFCLHVIRRQSVRVPIIGGLLAAFFALSVSAEALGWNESMRATVFPQTQLATVASNQYRKLVATAGTRSSQPAVASSSSSSLASSSSSSVASSVIASRSSSSAPTIAAVISSSSSSRPASLPRSGPEDIAVVLIVSLLALYCRTLHVRALRRLE